MHSEYESGSDIEREICIIHGVAKKYFCSDCIKFICLRCGQTSHVSHNWKDISDILKELEQLKKDAEEWRGHNTNRLHQNTDRLERRRLSLKSTIDMLVDNTKNEYERGITQVYQQRLMTLESDIEREISSLKMYISHPEVFYTQGHTSSGQALAEKIKDIFDQRSHLETMKDTAVLHVCSADDSQLEDKVKSMFGIIIDFQKTESILLYHFEMENITQIVTVSESLAWIGSSGEKEIKLINIDGKILNTCKLAVALESFAVGKTDKLLITTSSNMSIRQVDIPQPKKINLTTYPTFVCMTAASEILVTSVSDLKNPVGKVLKGPYSTFRNLVEMEIGRKTLTCPLKIAENDNGDLCILNKTSKKSNKTELIVLKKDGTLSVLFDGDEDVLEISDFAFDKYGNIICSESTRDTILLIFWNGEKFEMLDICKRESPIALACRGNYLWSSSRNGNIQVHLLKYHFVCAD